MITRMLFYSFDGTTFPLFFCVCSLKSCIAVFEFEEGITSSSFYSLASGEKYLHKSAQLGILRLFQNFSVDGMYPLHTYSSLLGYS